MPKPFKFRYVNELTGGLVIFVTVLLIAGVFFAGKAQRWFEPVMVVNTVFPEEGSFGMKKGAEVRIQETQVGTLDRISVDDNDQIQAVMKIRGEFARYVRSDSVAILKRKLGLTGDSFIEITKGTGSALPEEGAFIESKKDVEIMAMAQEILDEVKEQMFPMLEEVQVILTETRKLTQDVNKPGGDIQNLLKNSSEMSSNANQMLKDITEGKGTLGRLVQDPVVLDKTVEILDHVEAMLADLKETTSYLPEITAMAAKELEDIEGMTYEARIALDEARKLMEGFQRHWLMKKYVDQVEPTERIATDEILLEE